MGKASKFIFALDRRNATIGPVQSSDTVDVPKARAAPAVINRSLFVFCIALLIACGTLLLWISRQYRTILALRFQTEAEHSEISQLTSTPGGVTGSAAPMKTPITHYLRWDGPMSALSAQDTPHDVDYYVRHDPAYADLERRQLLLQIQTQYPTLKDLGLSGAQQSQLQTLLMNRLHAADDAEQAGLDRGFAQNSPELRQMMGDADRAANQAIVDLIGQDRMNQLTAMDVAASYRSTVQIDYGQDLARYGLPLNADQLEALSLAGGEAQLTAAAKGMRGMDVQAATRAAMASTASKILSPEQLNIYQQMTQLQQDWSAMQTRARAAMNHARESNDRP